MSGRGELRTVIERPGISVDSEVVADEEEVEASLVVGFSEDTWAGCQCPVEYVRGEREFDSGRVDS